MEFAEWLHTRNWLNYNNWWSTPRTRRVWWWVLTKFKTRP
jgi:hypothetical protein